MPARVRCRSHFVTLARHRDDLQPERAAGAAVQPAADQATMLRKLLQRDIKRESGLILQCFKHLVSRHAPPL